MRATDPTTPKGWAIVLSQMWGPRFPVLVDRIALEYTTRFPDPILKVAKADLPSFEGALLPLEKKGGWAILYNPTIRSDGRINYTLGHELGHYFAHRAGVPAGFECGQRDVLGIAARAEHRQREREADEFASYLLMPLDDFRLQTASAPMSLDMLKHLSDRYGVSFTAGALKWLESTELCAVVVVATNGFINWCSRSDAAMKSGIFYQSGTELPPASIAALGDQAQRNEGTTLAAGIWSNRSVREIAIFADHYEMTISLLIFDHDRMRGDGWRDEVVEDSFDRFESSVAGRRSWD
jgi:hypothetical protein